MTSLQRIKRKNGAAWRIQFFINGERKTLYLGVHYTRAHAVEIDAIVKKIVDATIAGVELDAPTRAWLDRISGDLRERFERAGLLGKRRAGTVAEIWREYATSHSFRTLRPATQRNKTQFFKMFARIAGDARLSELTGEKIAEICDALSANYATATRASVLKTVSVALNWAVEREIIVKNPLAKIPKGTTQNKARECFIDQATAKKILENCRSDAARTAFALCRFGGLRRGEAFILRWSDVLWSRGRVVVTSPKTQNAGKDRREIPLFPELRAELERARDILPPSETIVGDSLTVSGALQALKAAARRAGVPVWPRFFQNLRASRANEIAQNHSSTAEAVWLGHDQTTALKHYLLVPDSEYDKATRSR